MNLKQLSVIGLLTINISTAMAAVTVYEFDSPQQEAQYQALINDFRCPTCQNQNLAGSDAPIAQDLKQKTYEMVKAGRSDSEIRAFMFERYGDFISYKPPVRPSTWILWFFPPVLLVLSLLVWVLKNRKKQAKLSSDSPVQALSAKEEANLQALLQTYQPKQTTPKASSDTDNANHDTKEQSS